MKLLKEKVKIEKGWKTIIDFTKIKKGGVRIEVVLKCLNKMIKEDNAKRMDKRKTRAHI